MEVVLRERNIPYESERIIPILFHGHVIGNLRSDIIIDKTIVLEFKVVKSLSDHADIQGYNYLRLTGIHTAYLINFPPMKNGKVEIRKITMESE
jgi:GxxExxY protein